MIYWFSGLSYYHLQGDTLRVILISTRLEAEIISLIVADEDAFAVTSDSLHLFRRGKECLKVEIRENDGGQCHVHGISMLGALLALFCEDNKIRFYSRDDLCLYSPSICVPNLVFICTDPLAIFYPRTPALIETLEVEAGSTITALLQPSTYLNKLLVARDDGSVSLWNVRRK